MHAILMTTLPRFLLEHKNSSDFFEMCLPPHTCPILSQAYRRRIVFTIGKIYFRFVTSR